MILIFSRKMRKEEKQYFKMVWLIQPKVHYIANKIFDFIASERVKLCYNFW